MYFLVALGLTAISAVLWFVFKNKKQLHLDILTLIFGSATLMWLIDCIASAIGGEGFLGFEIPTDVYISLATLGGGLVLWVALLLILNRKKEAAPIQE